MFFFLLQAEDGIRDRNVTGVQTCALPILRRVTAAWVGNVSEGLGHCYLRACEQGVPRSIEVHDHSNFSISLALWAAAWNVSSLPTRTLLGSDILRTNPNLSSGDGLVHVAAVRPDVAVIHVQRADAQGHG